MPQYQFFRSEEQQYSLGNVELSQANNMARDLVKAIKEAPKIDETIALMMGYDGNTHGPCNLSGYESFFAWGIYSRGLSVKTELVYTDAEGNLMAASKTVYEQDMKRNVTSLFDLASFRREDEEVLFTIHPLHQIGVDPQFLYGFGQKHGRRTNL